MAGGPYDVDVPGDEATPWVEGFGWGSYHWMWGSWNRWYTVDRGRPWEMMLTLEATPRSPGHRLSFAMLCMLVVTLKCLWVVWSWSEGPKMKQAWAFSFRGTSLESFKTTADRIDSPSFANQSVGFGPSANPPAPVRMATRTNEFRWTLGCWAKVRSPCGAAGRVGGLRRLGFRVAGGAWREEPAAPSSGSASSWVKSCHVNKRLLHLTTPLLLQL